MSWFRIGRLRVGVCVLRGHLVFEKGLEFDRAKIEIIEKLVPSFSVKGVQNFLGHTGFYKRFIKDFSKISKPLTNLLANDVPFVFDEICVTLFNRLNEALNTTSVI